MTLTKQKIKNAMTVDVEDYFHVAAFSDNISQRDWGKMKSRVEKNTQTILDDFQASGIKATFFVLGWVAERYPQIVRQIAERGHEVACHGYSHQLIYRQNQSLFYDETRKAKEILEDIAQKPVRGYRAASYSITRQSLWALDVLAELGFEYDSSIVPVHHDLYGIPGLPRFPHIIKAPGGEELVEFPPSTLSFSRINLPIAGGGYFRLYPYWFSKAGMGWINKRENMPFIFYLHPWEVDSGQPRMQGKWFSKFRHYNNINKCRSRLNMLMQDFEFTTVLNILESMKLIDQVTHISQPATLATI